MLKPVGLTYPQYITLTLLWQQDAQGVGALARQLSLKTSTLTPLLKRLEAMGLVTRQRSSADERQVHIHLTEAGSALRMTAGPITECVIASTGLDIETLQRLVAKLNQLSQHMQDNKSAAT